MKDVQEVLAQKERDLMNARMDVQALIRCAKILSEPGDCVEALRTLTAAAAPVEKKP